MRSKNAGSEGQIDLFGTRLADLLDSAHPLDVLADRIDWQRFETKFGVHFAESSGRPALATRLVIALEYLKYTFNESDESIVQKSTENPSSVLLWLGALFAPAALSSDFAREVAGSRWRFRGRNKLMKFLEK